MRTINDRHAYQRPTLAEYDTLLAKNQALQAAIDRVENVLDDIDNSVHIDTDRTFWHGVRYMSNTIRAALDNVDKRVY